MKTAIILFFILFVGYFYMIINDYRNNIFYDEYYYDNLPKKVNTTEKILPEIAVLTNIKAFCSEFYYPKRKNQTD